MMQVIVTLLLFLSAFQLVLAQDDARKLQKVFDSYGYTGAFILAPLDGEERVRINPERCSEAVIPASTFKIPNSCISLETRVVTGIHDSLPWDGKKKAFESWERDMDMYTAFSLSCVWFYQQLARRIGPHTMSQWLHRIAYGNESISGGIDRFWLDGKLRISPDQQIDFLQKLFSDALPFRPEVMQQVRELMVFEHGKHYTLYGKTGLGIMNLVHYGWFVGAIDIEGGIWLFATLLVKHNADSVSFPEARIRITRALLREARLLPQE